MERQEEPPPPYEVDKDASLVQDADSDADWDSDLDFDAKSDQCPPDWQTGPFNLDIICRPNNTTDWLARLQVHAKDVPRLMKKGFYWTEANVRKRAGYFLLEKASLPADVRDHWDYARAYHLTDIAKDGNQQWIAVLWVFALKLSVLSNFRVRHLSVDQIRFARAYDGERRPIYDFDVHYPGDSFNAVYDDMPLGGWWPWPKKS